MAPDRSRADSQNGLVIDTVAWVHLVNGTILCARPRGTDVFFGCAERGYLSVTSAVSGRDAEEEPAARTKVPASSVQPPSAQC